MSGSKNPRFLDASKPGGGFDCSSPGLRISQGQGSPRPPQTEERSRACNRREISLLTNSSDRPAHLSRLQESPILESAQDPNYEDLDIREVRETVAYEFSQESPDLSSYP